MGLNFPYIDPSNPAPRPLLKSEMAGLWQDLQNVGVHTLADIVYDSEGRFRTATINGQAYTFTYDISGGLSRVEWADYILDITRDSQDQIASITTSEV